MKRRILIRGVMMIARGRGYSDLLDIWLSDLANDISTKTLLYVLLMHTPTHTYTLTHLLDICFHIFFLWFFMTHIIVIFLDIKKASPNFEQSLLFC